MPLAGLPGGLRLALSGPAAGMAGMAVGSTMPSLRCSGGQAPVLARAGNEMAAGEVGRGYLRASHADREQVCGMLKAAFVQGRLTKDELDARVGQTFAARTYADLAALTADLPAGLTEAQPPKPARVEAPKPVLRASRVIMAASVLYAGVWVYVPLSPKGGDNGTAFLLVVLSTMFYFTMLIVAGVEKLDLWLLRRSGRQLPPRPRQRRRANGGEQGGRAGDDLMFCQARSSAHASHLPGHVAIRPSCWSLLVRRDQRGPADFQVTA
jgi:Domain of unknown function (DUF1707)